MWPLKTRGIFQNHHVGPAVLYPVEESLFSSLNLPASSFITVFLFLLLVIAEHWRFPSRGSYSWKSGGNDLISVKTYSSSGTHGVDMWPLH